MKRLDECLAQSMYYMCASYSYFFILLISLLFNFIKALQDVTNGFPFIDGNVEP